MVAFSVCSTEDMARERRMRFIDPDSEPLVLAADGAPPSTLEPKPLLARLVWRLPPSWLCDLGRMAPGRTGAFRPLPAAWLGLLESNGGSLRRSGGPRAVVCALPKLACPLVFGPGSALKETRLTGSVLFPSLVARVRSASSPGGEYAPLLAPQPMGRAGGGTRAARERTSATSE